MSATTTRVPLAEATAIAEELVALLRSACERIAIAGSIRRQLPDVGDIDLVLEPTFTTEPAGLFGDQIETVNLLDRQCESLCRAAPDGRGILAEWLDKNGRRCWGTSLKRAVFRGLNVDLQSVVDPDVWGMWLLVRTGPASFNRRLVTLRSQGGWLPSGFQFKDGFRLMRYGGLVPTPTEGSVFEALGLPWVEPENRR